tara:strand:- start:2404 stop:3567 length:1164 start_codon:yes stop_codon:yes gene_type:complete
MPVPVKPDSAAIVGVGYTELRRKPDRTDVEIGIESCRMAAADAGIDLSEVDGICVQGHHYPEPDTDAIARGLGLKNYTSWRNNGAIGMAGVGMATRAIESGKAKAIFICKILNTVAPVLTPLIDPDTGEVDGPAQFEVPYGLGYTMQRVGLYCRRYMHQYGITPEQVGWVSVVSREHSIEHPYGYQKKPITIDDYMESRWIAEPIRLLDCDIPVNGAFTYLITSGERARHLRHPPVWVKGWVTPPNPECYDDHLWELPGEEMTPVAQQLYRETGLSPKDMDLVSPYDGFSFFVPIWLENLGICKRGEAGELLEGGDRIRRTGDTPINTHGGNLSCGRMHGQGHVLEVVEQLRRTAGDRQIAKPMKHAVLATSFPFSGFVGILSSELD